MANGRTQPLLNRSSAFQIVKDIETSGPCFGYEFKWMGECSSLHWSLCRHWEFELKRQHKALG